MLGTKKKSGFFTTEDPVKNETDSDSGVAFTESVMSESSRISIQRPNGQAEHLISLKGGPRAVVKQPSDTSSTL